MRAFTEPRYKRAVLVTSAQSAKTEALFDIIGERLDNRPAPGLYVAPSRDFIVDQFEPRLVDMFSQAASLLSKITGGINGKRQKRTLKRVNGTRLRLAHAGSSTALKSDPAAFALIDEYDEMLKNVRGQGDPLGLVEARGDTFADFMIGVTSTPSTGLVETEIDKLTGLEFWKPADEDAVQSPIWRLWQAGTRHHWCWRCPHCRGWFVPRFECLSWPSEATPMRALREAYVTCPRSGCIIQDSEKRGMNASGVFVAPGQTIRNDGSVLGDPADVPTLSFWVSGLASPFQTFGQRARAYLEAHRSREHEKIQTAMNAQFGEVYSYAGGDVPEWQAIHGRRLPYKFDQIPAGARYLTCGIDVQRTRLVYVVRAWGRRATSWLIRHGEIYGDTSERQVWSDLQELLTNEIGGRLIKLAFIDSGFRPGKRFQVPVHRVYDFCRRLQRFVFATKGSSHPLAKPIVQSRIEITREGSADRYGLSLMRLDSDHWKSFVHERLRWPADQDGAWHIGEDASETYCKQLVAEARIIDPNGRPRWIERSRENHFLDAESLAAAAAHMLNVQNIRSALVQSIDTVTLPPDLTIGSEVLVAPKKRRSLGELAKRLNR